MAAGKRAYPARRVKITKPFATHHVYLIEELAMAVSTKDMGSSQGVGLWKLGGGSGVDDRRG